MKFDEVVRNLLKPAKQEVPLSRIYGYKRMPDGKIQIIDAEAHIIASAVIHLASRPLESIESILDELIAQFNAEGLRNRSGKRWTRQTLLSLIRPIYGGIAVSPNGVWRRSKIYPPIVAAERLKAAMKRLKTAKIAPRATKSPSLGENDGGVMRSNR